MEPTRERKNKKINTAIRQNFSTAFFYTVYNKFFNRTDFKYIYLLLHDGVAPIKKRQILEMRNCFSSYAEVEFVQICES